jgi:hypothetical protein
MYRLLSHLKVPPGQFCYEQTQGIYRKFESTPLMEQLANSVADFRKGNGLPGASYEQAIADIDAFNCLRLGNMPAWCYNTDKSPEQVVAEYKPKGCRTCGHPV